MIHESICTLIFSITVYNVSSRTCIKSKGRLVSQILVQKDPSFWICGIIFTAKSLLNWLDGGEDLDSRFFICNAASSNNPVFPVWIITCTFFKTKKIVNYTDFILLPKALNTFYTWLLLFFLLTRLIWLLKQIRFFCNVTHYKK